VDVRTRVRPTYVYLYMLLASFYTWSIYSKLWSQKLVTLVLTASMALACGRSARLAALSGSRRRAAARSTADGLIAATAFFILQGILLLFSAREHASHHHRLRHCRTDRTADAAGLLAQQGDRRAGHPARCKTLALIAAARHRGSIACAVGIAYWRSSTQLWPKSQAAAGGSRVDAGTGRGRRAAVRRIHLPWLDLRRLRRSMSALPAMVMSAAIFAVVHPPLSMLPVFVLGLCAAWTYERSKTAGADAGPCGVQRRHLRSFGNHLDLEIKPPTR
jgi:hypothetical protein